MIVVFINIAIKKGVRNISYIFGVDTIYPANTQLKNGYILYDWIMRKNHSLTFWGRNLTGKYPITTNEIEFFQKKNCKVQLFATGLDELRITTNDAASDVTEIVEAAMSLGVPQNKGITIFAEIPSDRCVNHNWMISYSFNLINSGYLPGFIGNTDSSKNFNFDREASHYIQATDFLSEYKTTFWATEPKIQGEPDIWSPFCPSAFTSKDIDLWSCNKIIIDEMEINETFIQNEELLKHMW